MFSTFAWKDTSYEVTLSDTHFDGRFDDRDRIWISPLNSGKSTRHRDQYGSLINVAGEYFERTTSPDGRRMVLERLQSPTGILHFDPVPSGLGMRFEDRFIRIDLEERVELPAGEYTLSHCAYSAPDGEGGMWSLWHQAGLQRHLLIEEGKQTDFPYGPPFTVSFQPPIERGSVFLSLQIVGRSGERYTWRHFGPDKRVTDQPHIGLFANGQRVRMLTSYYCEVGRDLSWYDGVDESGSYTAEFMPRLPWEAEYIPLNFTVPLKGDEPHE